MEAAHEQGGAHIAQTNPRPTAEAGHHSQPPANLVPERPTQACEPEPAAARRGPGLSTRVEPGCPRVRVVMGAAYEQGGAQVAQTNLRPTAEAGHHSQSSVNLLLERPTRASEPKPAATKTDLGCRRGRNQAGRGVKVLVGAAYEQVGAHIAQTHLRLTAEAGHHSQPPVNLLPEGQHEPLSRSRPPQRQTWAVDKGWNRTARGVRVVMGAAYEQGGAQVAQTNLRLTAEAGHHSQTPVNL